MRLILFSKLDFLQRMKQFSNTISHIYQDDAQNALRISEFWHYKGAVTFKQFAIKMVVLGSEKYALTNKTHLLEKENFIIGYGENNAEAIIKEPTIGICIDLSEKLVFEIIQHRYNHTGLKEFVANSWGNTQQFALNNSHLGNALKSIKTLCMQHKANHHLNQAFFYNLAEKYVEDQASAFQQIAALPFKKKATCRHIFDKLIQAKAHMDVHFLTKPNIDILAKHAGISKFAFIRLFKQCFGTSPYQYQQRLRLNKAKTLLLNGYTVSEVALLTGFSDLPTFSKAFKSCFEKNPNQMLK